MRPSQSHNNQPDLGHLEPEVKHDNLVSLLYNEGLYMEHSCVLLVALA